MKKSSFPVADHVGGGGEGGKQTGLRGLAKGKKGRDTTNQRKEKGSHRRRQENVGKKGEEEKEGKVGHYAIAKFKMRRERSADRIGEKPKKKRKGYSNTSRSSCGRKGGEERESSE